jgi:hypothetical protein
LKCYRYKSRILSWKRTKILAPLNAIPNLIINEEKIKVKVINTNTNCYIESSFKLIISVLPKANPLQEIIGCDDNNDGISEYFDTSNVESKVLGNQTGMKVTYFDSDGNQLPNPLPNPFTNTVANLEKGKSFKPSNKLLFSNIFKFSNIN